MPTYEVRRKRALVVATVTPANETEARLLARDAWQQDAAIESLTADVTRVPNLDPFDAYMDEVSEARYVETDTDREDENTKQQRMGLGARVRPTEEVEPW